MEVLFAIPLLLIPFFWPVLTGLMARSFGRKFWPWFFLGIPLPFIAMVILLCLPDKKSNLVVVDDRAVSNEEIFEQLLIENTHNKKLTDGVCFSATA